MMQFIECPTCSSKPGSPILCAACYHNRAIIEKLKKYSEVKPMVKKIEIYEEALSFIANQKDKTGNWAVELAKRVLKEAKSV